MCGYRTLTGARAPPTGPQAEGDVGPPFSGKRERAPALSLSSPWVLVRLSSGVGRLLKGIHPPFRPIACPGKAADPGSSPQKPIGSHAPNRPTDSPGRASRSGQQPAKNPKALTHLSVQRPSPGRARLAEFRRPQPAEKIQSYFPRACTGENIPLTPRVPASPARFGVHPPILGGASHQAEYLTPPYSAVPNEAPTSLAPPKIQYAKWFRS